MIFARFRFILTVRISKLLSKSFFFTKMDAGIGVFKGSIKKDTNDKPFEKRS